MRWYPLDKLPELEARLAQDVHRGTRTEQRDALAMALSLHGLRVGEVSRARTEELYVAGRQLHVPPFKRGNARIIPLHQSLIEVIPERAGKHA